MRMKKNKEKIENEPYYIFLTIIIIVSIFARIINFGYSLLLLLIPIIIYFVVFGYKNLEFIEYIGKVKNAKETFFTSCVTFLLACIIIPDSVGNEGSNTISVFRLLNENNGNIQSEFFDILYKISYVLIAINIITLIIESFIIIKEKKNRIVNNSENNTDKDIKN